MAENFDLLAELRVHRGLARRHERSDRAILARAKRNFANLSLGSTQHVDALLNHLCHLVATWCLSG